MPDTETYYDPNSNAYKTRKTSTADDVEDAKTAEKLQNFKAPAAGSKPVQSEDEEEPPKNTIRHSIWEKRQKQKQMDAAAKTQGQRAAASKL